MTQKKTSELKKKKGGQKKSTNHPVRNTAKALSVRQIKIAPEMRCSLEYLQSLTNPFDPNASVCIPIFPRPSQKVSVVRRGLVTTGTTRFGYLWAAPQLIKGANTVVTQASTDADYAGTITQVLRFNNDPEPGVVQTFANNSGLNFPWDHQEGISARLVSKGIRFRYVGTELNRGGTVAIINSPAPTAAWQIDEVFNHPKARRYNLTTHTGWMNCTYVPRGHEDLEYERTVQVLNPGFAQMIFPKNYHAPEASPLTGEKCYCIMAFAAVSAVPLTLEWEEITHVEYVGRPVSNVTTKSHSGPGTEAIVDAVREEFIENTSAPDVSSFERITGTLSSTARQVVDAVGGPRVLARELFRSYNLARPGGLMLGL